MNSAQRTSMGWATAALGLAGLACGIVALAADLAFFGLIAGILAVGAGAAGFAAASAAPRADAENDTESHGPAPLATSPAGLINDELTGLRSESYFVAAAGDRIDAARRYLRPVALILLEIRANQGAEISLVEAGRTLTETLRDADMTCRRSDDSFAVLLEDTPETGARLVVERLRPALRGRLGDVIVAAGVACYPAHGLDLEAIWEQAESALALARRSERDITQVAEPD